MRRRFVAIVLVALVAACGGVSHPYSKQVQDAFMSGCTGSDKGVQATADCLCLLTWYEKNVPSAELAQAVNDKSQGAKADAACAPSSDAP